MPGKKLDVLGIKMDCLSYTDMYPIFDAWLSDRDSRSHTMALVNVNACVSSLFDRDLGRIYNSADIVGIDGMPFVWLARLFRNKKSDRFYAPDLMLEIGSKAREKGYTFFLYGGAADAPDRMEEYLTERCGPISIVGKYSPPFRPLTDEEDQAVCDMINAVKPHFLWVGLGAPKQEVWIHLHRTRIRGSIIVGSGATFDFFSGRIRQAPKLIRDVGFEWLFRLFHDFRRLWVRYIVYNAIFFVVYPLQLLRIVRFDD